MNEKLALLSLILGISNATYAIPMHLWGDNTENGRFCTSCGVRRTTNNSSANDCPQSSQALTSVTMGELASTLTAEMISTLFRGLSHREHLDLVGFGAEVAAMMPDTSTTQAIHFDTAILPNGIADSSARSATTSIVRNPSGEVGVLRYMFGSGTSSGNRS